MDHSGVAKAVVIGKNLKGEFNYPMRAVSTFVFATFNFLSCPLIKIEILLGIFIILKTLLSEPGV